MVRSQVPPRGVPKISVAQKAGQEERSAGGLNSARQLKKDENSRRDSTAEMKDRPGRSWGNGELMLKSSETMRDLMAENGGRFQPATAQFDFRHILAGKVSHERPSARRENATRRETRRSVVTNRRTQVTTRQVPYRVVGQEEELRTVDVVKAPSNRFKPAVPVDLSGVLKNRIGLPSQRQPAPREASPTRFGGGAQLGSSGAAGASSSSVAGGSAPPKRPSSAPTMPAARGDSEADHEAAVVVQAALRGVIGRRETQRKLDALGTGGVS